MKRQKTQRELRAEKNKKSEEVIVYNVSNQKVSLQLRAPIDTDNGKRRNFYQYEQQVDILHKKSAVLPKDRLDPDQLLTLQQRGMIRVKPIIGS